MEPELTYKKHTKLKGYVVCQSPILTHPRVESTPYALRLTPLSKYGVLEVENFLINSQEWIYSLETSKKGQEHFHIVLWSALDEESFRQTVRDFLLRYFPDKPKRGDANKQYNLSEVEDLVSSVTYLLKDQGITKFSSGVDSSVIEHLSKQSYKKFSKEEFSKQLEDLKIKFKDESPKLIDMMTDIVKLKAMYRQPVNMNQIHQMCVSFDCHNNPTLAYEYVGEFLSRYK